MLREMAGLGFGHVELSHGIRIALVPGILKAVEEGVVKVSSTHNICPLPAGVTQAAPNIFQPSSPDWRERQQWVLHTKRSIEFGAQMGARALVCHLGSVAFFWRNPARSLEAYARRNPVSGPLAGDKAYQALLARAVGKLRRRMGPYWENTKSCVGEVLGHAGEKGIRLGFEIREKFEELPVDADFPGFLAGLPAGSAAGYWHDVGHAQIKQNMGLIDHRRHLAENARSLVGFHLHDVSPEGNDHQATGTGCIDFQMVSEFWRPEHLLVLELGPRVTTDEVISSKSRVEALIDRQAAG
jgi:sugar phosphate isomerase/epimerase